ncbi:hypothetical protein PV08_09584 [Exophiala spinifera]|uniref:Amidoligase enzyme n=1 Tax=Exophiala spinifera TaxID=91928 RepID=A0A0D1ZH94_9EURO|nr:uncharacterized protein PV08_09584 [Exophiala spinifera]KIW12307.1 hypothetical protein PV08_09584 [Exophiala spinifera]
MSNAPEMLPLTFGVEIELLFAVNFDMLQTRQPLTPLLTLLRENLRPDPRDQLVDANTQWEDKLLYAAGILRKRGLEFTVHDPPDNRPDDDAEFFSNWMLTSETAVPTPVSKTQVAKWSNLRILTLDGWDFMGLELISRILDAPNPQASNGESESLSQVSRYLELMTKRTSAHPHFEFLGHPETTSIHVHIGLSPSATGQRAIPLHVLRHLAWIILTFEDTITLLHHPQRHGYHRTKSESHALPNRVGYGFRLYEHVHQCQPFDPVKAFFSIFNFSITDENEGLDELRHIVCGTRAWSGDISFYRAYFVNFCNIVPSDPWSTKTTVEFRQHHGTLDQKDISEWIAFVTALVRAAEKKAYEVPTKGALIQELPGSLDGATVHDSPRLVEELSKYASILKTPKRSLKQLFDLLDLPIERRQYWWARAVNFQTLLRQGGFRYKQCRLLSLCKEPRLRDCEGWREGELDDPPWDLEEGDSSGDSSGLGISTPRSSFE